jgi:hypothetical protein
VYNERGDCGSESRAIGGDMRESQHYPLEAKTDDAEFVEFVRAGERAAGDFECVACGYIDVVRAELRSCPVCGSLLWERSSRTPFATVFSDLGRRLALAQGSRGDQSADSSPDATRRAAAPARNA